MDMTHIPHILVVDDQKGIRRLVQEIFRGDPYRVSLAANGAEALETAAKDCPHLVLLDVKMPVMDGVETLRRLRQVHPLIPVIIMTAVGDGDRVREALGLGAICSVTKPFDVHQLRNLISSTISGGSQAVAESAAAYPGETDDDPGPEEG